MRAEAKDDDGETAVADLTISVVSNTPPLVELVKPADGTMFGIGETIELLAEASDPGGGVDRVDYYVRDANLFSAANRLVASVDQAPYAFDLEGLPPGSYMLSAVAVDDDGASSEGIPVHIHVHPAHQLLLPAVVR